MIKCGVCGSENEAAALFCGVCGSPLPQAETPPVVDEATKPEPIAEPAPSDDSVVPGKGGARRDLGVGTEPVKTAPVIPSTPEPPVSEVDSGTGPTVVCQVCGTVNDATRTYCRKCANELKPAPAPPPDVPPPPPARQISPVLLGLGAAGVVVAIGIIVVLALGGTVTPSQSPSAAASQPNVTQAPTGTDVATLEPSAPAGEELGGRIIWAGGNRAGGSGDRELFMADAADASTSRQLTDRDGFSRDPGADPAGDRVAYSSTVGLRILTIDGGDDVSLTDFGRDINPCWSPIEDRVVFTGRRNENGTLESDMEIRIKFIDEEDSDPLTDNDIEDHDPVFTMDGKFVIWVQGEGDDRELMKVEIDDPDNVEALTDDDFNDVDPAVSSDGQFLAFASNRGGDGFDLWLLDLVNGGDPVPLPALEGIDEHDPWFSPGGRYIVFSAGPTEAEDIYILDREASPESAITPFITDDGRELSPIWLP